MSRRLAANEPFAVKFEPKNASQEEVIRLWDKSDVLFLLGAAGTGKSLVAVALAAQDVQQKKAQKVVFLRPTAEADRTLGYTPGTNDEKVAPFMRPLYENLAKVTYKFPADKVQSDVLGLIRGITYNDSRVILDEAQNATYRQLKLAVTRLGYGSKLVIVGDPSQSDIRSTSADYESDLDEAADDLEGAANVGIVEFGEHEVLRHSRLSALIKRFRR